MITLQDVLKKTTEFLSQKKMPHPRREAQEVLSYSLNMPRIELYMHFDRPVDEQELSTIRDVLKRRVNREPIQYIRGEVDFFGATLQVNSQVLIPRQETELMVSEISAQLKEQDLESKVLWDVCTGSGCIAISLKKKFPKLKVMASDLSKEALEVAKHNAKKNNVEISFLQADLLDAPIEPVDFIVCNPPYISEEEYQTLEPEVAQFEPKMSLVSGLTGLEVYQSLSKEIKKILKPNGKAWMEIGHSQKKSLQEIFNLKESVTLSFFKDLAGHDRFFLLELE